MTSHSHPPGARVSAVSILASLALVVALLPFAPATATEGDTQRADVHPDLQAEAAQGPTEAVIVLEARPNLAPIAGDRDAVVEALKTVAAEAQAELFASMRAQPETFAGVDVVNTFWIQNMVLVTVEDTDALEAAAALPGVDRLVPNFTVQAPDPQPTSDDTSPAIIDDLTWGVDRIEADRVWSELGLDGSGVRVATLDTGVAIDHPDLEGKLVTDNPADPRFPGGWMEFDANGNRVASEPHDSSTHGTHVAGTIHGGAHSGVSIGAAPGADMMHGLVIPFGSGTFVQVAAGMEWAIDPVDADGNPAGEPADVVNMSLGGDGLHDEMIDPARNLYLAGIFPAMSIGNSGQGVTGSPGNVYESVGVGATDIDDDVAGFSAGDVIDRDSWSDPPGDWPDSYLKPDISAPGVDVWSATPAGGYRYASGTSMAAPHVAGAVALILEGAPESSVDLVLDTLADTAFWDDRHSDSQPDTFFGWGRINAFEAASVLAIDSGVEGTVTDADNDEPIAGATVSVAGEDVGVSTGDDGGYVLRLEPGTYEIEVSAFGYDDDSATVSVSEEEFTTQDFALDPGPRGDVAGTVTLDSSGQGIPGVHVEILGVPVDLSAETGTDGEYHIADIPVGTYDVSAAHPHFPEAGTVTVDVAEGETATADFAFDDPSFELVGVLGDYQGTTTEFLNDHMVDAEEIGWDDPVADYGVIVVNRPGDPGEDDFLQFLADTDAAGVGVVFTDTWSTLGNGILLLQTHVGNPAERQTGTGSGIPYLSYEVTEEHEILDGFEVGDEIVFDEVTTFKDHAWFDGYEGDGRASIADVARSDQEETVGRGIGVHERGTNRHALVSMHASSLWTQPEDWHPDSQALFLNAVSWVAPDPGEEPPVFVHHDLEVDPDTIISGGSVDIDVAVTNVGGSAGEHDVVLRIDGETEDTTTVTLDPGGTADVSWTVSRDELGTYEVAVGHLTDEFRVRPALVEVTALTVDAPGADDPGPLAGAAVALIDDGDLSHVGHTDDDGRLTFEAPGEVSQVTVVVHTADGAADAAEQYLLTRDVDVTDDIAVTFAPVALPDDPGEGDEDLVTTVDLDLDAVDEDHTAAVYVRGGATAPHGFGFDPGTLYATVDDYDTVAAHHLPGTAQDWWYASAIEAGHDWTGADAFGLTLGGELALDVSAEATGDGLEIAVEWDLADGAGTSIDTIMVSAFGAFAERLPATLVLEDLADALAGHSERDAEVIGTVYDRRGEAIHAGGLEWGQRAFTYDLGDYDSNPRGTYTFGLTAKTGPYAGTIEASDTHQAPRGGGGGGGGGGNGGGGNQGGGGGNGNGN